MTGSNVTYAFHGGVRETGDSDDSLNRCVAAPSLTEPREPRTDSRLHLLRLATEDGRTSLCKPTRSTTSPDPFYPTQSSSRPGRTPSKAVLDAKTFDWTRPPPFTFSLSRLGIQLREALVVGMGGRTEGDESL
jgi:hypothetical protein